MTIDRSSMRGRVRPRSSAPAAARRLAIPWELAALVFPLASVFYASAGFLVGLPVARWQGLCGLATSLLLCIPGSNALFRTAQKMGAVLLLIVACIAISGLSVMYSNPDAEIYHRPASILLADGWNPVFDSAAEVIAGFEQKNQRLKVLHVAFLPRAFWTFGAVLYRTVGFVEAADTLNILTCILSFFMVSRLLARLLGLRGAVRHTAAVLLAVSPVVATLMFGGSSDSAGYSLFLIATSAATLYLATGRTSWLAHVVLAFPLLANLKYTGVTCCGIVTLVYLVACVVRWRSGQAGPELPSRWLLAVAASVALAAVIGFSPYVTSWVRYGGPFYPAHTFDKRVSQSNLITADFLSMNDDARRMGYLGRFCYAYVSEPLTLWCHGKGADGGPFAPRFDVSGGVGGFGPVFRAAFVLSLAMLPFAGVGRLAPVLACILLTVLLQPTMYVGYSRYVPQFYAFPLLVFLAFARRIGGGPGPAVSAESRFARLTRWAMPLTIAASAACYSLPLLAYPLSFLALQWIISVQNLEITKAMRADPAPVVFARTFYSHQTLENDYGCSTITFITLEEAPQALAAGRHRYGSYFATDAFGYSYFSPDRIENFPELHHEVSANDPSIIASRNRRNMEFFLFSFLPRQFVRLPIYLFDVARLRCLQLGHAWRTTGAAYKVPCP